MELPPGDEWLKRLQDHRVPLQYTGAFVDVLDTCQGAARILRQATGAETVDQMAAAVLTKLICERAWRETDLLTQEIDSED